MKLSFPSIILVLFAPVAFAQPDMHQPDSVYRINKVRSMLFKYGGYGRQNCILTNFDSNGKALTSTMFDRKGEKKWWETIFEYDSSHKLVKSLYCSYMNSDKLTGAEMPDPLLDSSKVNISYYSYDDAGRLVKITGTMGPDKTPAETLFYYDPLISVWKFYKLKDTLLTTLITAFETPTIAKSILSSYDSGLVTKDSWQEKYKNIFDRSGRLIKRIVQFPSDPAFRKEMFYEYNDKGLLIKTWVHYRGEQIDYEVRLYEYQYRDDCDPTVT